MEPDLPSSCCLILASAVEAAVTFLFVTENSGDEGILDSAFDLIG